MSETLYIYGCGHQYHANCLQEELERDDEGTGAATRDPDQSANSKAHKLQFKSVKKNCPICDKQNYLAVREAKERRSRRMKQKRARSSQLLTFTQKEVTSSSDEGNSDNEQDRYTMAGGKDDDDEDGEQIEFNRDNDFEAKFKQDVLTKKLDRFDQILDDIQLELTEFEA